MNTEIYTALIVCVILLVLLYIFDEGGLLIIFGILTGIIALKFTSLFTITDTDLNLIFRIVYALIAIFAIGKSMYMRHEIIGDMNNNGD